MISKKITYDQLEQAVRTAFDGDKDIFRMYDKNVSVSTLDELVKDIVDKMKEYPNLSMFAVYEGSKIVGYFSYMDVHLISFGLAVSHRNRKTKRAFFQSIRQELKGRFCCLLWSRNIRAVKWLLSNGLKILDTNPHITQLIY